MASGIWQWVLRACLSIAGLLLVVGMGYLTSWAMQTANPLRSELLVGSALALTIGFQFALVAVAIARWHDRILSKRIVWTSYIVFAAIVALALTVAGVH